jgi:hypothetical protein
MRQGQKKAGKQAKENGWREEIRKIYRLLSCVCFGVSGFSKQL